MWNLVEPMLRRGWPDTAPGAAGPCRTGKPGIEGLCELRYVVEETFALLHQFRRLAVRRERRLEIYDGLVDLACADLLASTDQLTDRTSC